jgi:26S proteasome regulatory subunit N7
MDVDAPVQKVLPDLSLADRRFLYGLPETTNKDQLKKEIKDAVVADNMTGFYLRLKADGVLELDKKTEDSMRDANASKLESLRATLDDATANLGETEVREAMLAIADYYCLIGDQEKALEQYEATLLKTVALGQKLDILFTQVRIGLFYEDSSLTRQSIKRAHQLMEEGSDWDRRNRLKIYEAIAAMQARRFSKSAGLFIQTLSTFSSFEIFDFEQYIFYTVVSAMLTLDRVSLKEKIIDSSEVLSVINKIPHLQAFLNAFYDGDYKSFFTQLLPLTDRIYKDRTLNPHARWFTKEMRVKAYTQFLESYRSVQLASMASQFGVSVDFMDEELSRFISMKRLNCKIDKVAGIVETNRPDSKNAQYATTLKQGDLLLNRVQKLAARVINL